MSAPHRLISRVASIISASMSVSRLGVHRTTEALLACRPAGYVLCDDPAADSLRILASAWPPGGKYTQSWMLALQCVNIL